MNWPINKRLPYPGKWRWGYHHYPVYGPAWAKGRCLVFGLGIVVMGIMVLLGLWTDFGNLRTSFPPSAAFIAAFLSMALPGSIAASWVRKAKLNRTTEQVAVVAIIAMGFILCPIIDRPASRFMEDSVVKYSSVTVEKRDQSSIPEPLLLADAVIAVLLYAFLSGVFALPRYFREPGLIEAHLQKRKLKEVTEQKMMTEAKLSVLQAQVEPHFLFNTLAAIRSSTRNDPDGAEATLDALVEYLRATIPKVREADTKKSLLGEQVQLCLYYLQVIQQRMGDRLTVHNRIPERLNSCAFPPLLLLSLVENAVKHGLEPKTSAGNITLDAATPNDHQLMVSVKDDGVGLSEGASSGVGLSNVRQQLQVLYDEKASFSIESNTEGGVAATIVIPLDRSID